MTTNLQELGKKLQDLAARSLQEQVRAAQRYNELIQKFGSGELFKQPAGTAYLRFVGEETVQYVGNLASLSLSYYQELFELGRTYNEKFFEQVVGGTPSGGATTPADSMQGASTASRRRVEIELSGAIGEEVTRSFVLESRRAEATDIYFLVSDFVGPEGTASFHAEIEFQPTRFTLRPGEERIVTMRLPLSSHLFLPGLRYLATALVRGYEDLELYINVSPAAPVATDAQDV